MYSIDFSLAGLHCPSSSVHASPLVQEYLLGTLFNQSDSHLANLKWQVMICEAEHQVVYGLVRGGSRIGVSRIRWSESRLSSR